MDLVEVNGTICDKEGHDFFKVNEDYLVCRACGEFIKIPQKKVKSVKCCPCNHGCKCYCSCCSHIHWTYYPPQITWTSPYTNTTGTVTTSNITIF